MCARACVYMCVFAHHTQREREREPGRLGETDRERGIGRGDLTSLDVKPPPVVFDVAVVQCAAYGQMALVRRSTLKRNASLVLGAKIRTFLRCFGAAAWKLIRIAYFVAAGAPTLCYCTLVVRDANACDRDGTMPQTIRQRQRDL